MSQQVQSSFQQVQVTTTPWANPTPAGLVALGVACFCFFALLTGKVVAKDAMPLIGCWLLGGALIQYTVALIDYKAPNSTGANTFLFFSGFFMLVGGMEMLLKTYYLNTGLTFDVRVDGWAWAVLTLVLLLWTPAFFKTPLALLTIVIFLDIALPFITLIDLGLIEKSYAVIPAYALLGAGIVGIYLSAAIVVNTAYGRAIFPMPGPIVK